MSAVRKGPAPANLVVPTYAFGSTVAHQGISGSVARAFAGGRLSVNGGASYRKSDPSIAIPDGIGLETIAATGTVGYHITRWLGAEAFVIRTLQESTARGEYNRTRIGIQFVTSKPVRIE